MGQNPNGIPSKHPNPTTKIGSKMGGEFTYQPKWDPKTVLNHGHISHELQLKGLAPGTLEMTATVLPKRAMSSCDFYPALLAVTNMVASYLPN